MPTTTNYSSRFQNQAAVEAYEAGEYGPGSYAATVWQWQRPVVEQTLKDFRSAEPGPIRLLDFACGTGRVLACLEPLVDRADGIDISENMVAVARGRCRLARLQVGDLLSQPELLAGEYDVISCFRFLLNAEPDLRRRVLARLRQALRAPGGRLLVNVHGNTHSLRHPAIVWRRWRERARPTGEMLNELSRREARQLLAESGFEIVRQHGFGMLPPTLHRTPLGPLAGALDRSLSGEHWWNNWSIDMLFICRPC
jgi:SAM-dependent methyltransferase